MKKFFAVSAIALSMSLGFTSCSDDDDSSSDGGDGGEASVCQVCEIAAGVASQTFCETEDGGFTVDGAESASEEELEAARELIRSTSMLEGAALEAALEAVGTPLSFDEQIAALEEAGATCVAQDAEVEVAE